MILGESQQFASPSEALAHISEAAWSDFKKSDYTPEQWHRACLIHTHDGEPTSKSECKLPVKTPDGTLNRNAVHAAAAALAGARGGLKGVSEDQKKSAASALKRYYSELDEDPPESLTQGEDFVTNFLAHYGVKGMRWGVRKKDDTGAKEGSAVKGAFRSNNTLKKYTGKTGYSPHTETRLALLGPAAALDPKVRAEFKEVDRKIQEGKAAEKAAADANKAKKVDLSSDLFKKADSSGRIGEVATVAGPSSKSLTTRKKNEQAADHHGLTSKQKKVLVGLGVTAGVAGYIAYKHYTKQPFIEPPFTKPEGWKDSFSPDKVGFNPKKLSREFISKRKVGNLAEGHSAFELIDPDKLHVDVSKGYADIRPIAGFANPHAKLMHTEMIDALDEMRAKYPSVRNMNLEVVPMSHQPGMESYTGGAFAAVMSVRPGEARIFYNDVMEAPTSFERKMQEKSFTPGIFQRGGLGSHEMGHLLAVAGGRQMPSFDVMTMPEKTMTQIFDKRKAMVEYNRVQDQLHKDLFLKHGFTFKELSKLSGYAATEPAEALAELHRFYDNNPAGFEKKLTAEQRAKAKALFDDLGGVNVDDLVRPRDLVPA